jgi:hypothetical protein
LLDTLNRHRGKGQQKITVKLKGVHHFEEPPSARTSMNAE